MKRSAAISSFPTIPLPHYQGVEGMSGGTYIVVSNRSVRNLLLSSWTMSRTRSGIYSGSRLFVIPECLYRESISLILYPAREGEAIGVASHRVSCIMFVGAASSRDRFMSVFARERLVTAQHSEAGSDRGNLSFTPPFSKGEQFRASEELVSSDKRQRNDIIEVTR
jgi:hypothetical protein